MKGHTHNGMPLCYPIALRGLWQRQTQSFGDVLAVSRVGLIKVANLALLNLFRNRFHRIHNVPNQLTLLIGIHQPIQIARLGVIIVAGAVIAAIRIT
jgi:hypothetical protein